MKRLGPDTGYDSMNDEEIAKPLYKLLNSVEMKNKLPKTILYSLNPNDNYVIASMINSFQDGVTPGKYNSAQPGGLTIQKTGCSIK